MTLSDYAASACMTVGAVFFLAGTLGLFRFPDLYCRLHALTKADNTGLGFVVLGLAIQAETWLAVVKLVIIWLLVLFAGASASYLIAGNAFEKGTRFWKR
ncbi:MAG: monovalent cation/H(+) antiporter subunit G [Campylobacterales bacterium]|jgi:multicomponent Na+:H+ antiporter subunit G